MQASQPNRGEKEGREQNDPALSKVIGRNMRSITITAREHDIRVS